MSITLQEPINVDEVIALVQRLTEEDKIRLGKALKAGMIDSTLEKLLAAFRTDELDMETITREVELVRQDRNEVPKTNTSLSQISGIGSNIWKGVNIDEYVYQERQ